MVGPAIHPGLFSPRLRGWRWSGLRACVVATLAQSRWSSGRALRAGESPSVILAIEEAELRVAVALSVESFLVRAEEPLVLLGSGTSQAPPADTVQLQQDFRLSVLGDRP